jgi:hypothetical protein
MSESRACSRCGAALAPTNEGPICPACLIEAALAEPDLTVTGTLLADGTPTGQTARTPDWVGPYRILAPVGEGGMGVVYLAEQAAPIRRRVALKLIKTLRRVANANPDHSFTQPALLQLVSFAGCST